MSDRFVLSSEPLPREFHARLRRGQWATSRRRSRRLKRRSMALLAAVAVPAFAAHAWPPLETGSSAAAASSRAASLPLTLARLGYAVPSSAVFQNTPAGQPLAPDAHSDADDRPVAAGPAARSLFVDGSGIDRTRALQCLTAAIYYEAASEPDDGQRAVAQVVLNRVAHPAYPKTVCGVVFQGSEKRTGCQFSFACDGSMARVPMRQYWDHAEAIARAALGGYVFTPIGLATHYHTSAVHPYWADTLTYIGTIGAHRFYRFGGPAGNLGTFRFAYAGGEPVAGPAPRAAGSPAAPDPVAIQRAYEQGFRIAQANALPSHLGALVQASAAPAPNYAPEIRARGGDAIYRADRLPDSSGVKAEYLTSGSWIAAPGG